MVRGILVGRGAVQLTKKLIVNVADYETRLALLENGQVIEVQHERTRDLGIVGNIYLGRVQRVLPGMQAAFVEIGLEKAAFLYVGDLVPPKSAEEKSPTQSQNGAPQKSAESNHTAENGAGEDDDSVEASLPWSSDSGVFPKASDIIHNQKNRGYASTERPAEKKRNDARRLRIEEVLKQGQELLVQVIKDAIGTKGPRITCNITLPGRHIVFMPTYDHVGVSRKIVAEDERNRLKSILDDVRPEGTGFVARTLSMGVADEKLRADANYLISVWRDIQKRMVNLPPASLVQPELGLVKKCARDRLSEDVDSLIIDCSESFERVKQFVQMVDTQLLEKVEHYDGNEAIFDHYGIETELARAMSRKVWLKSGGYLIFDEAEALTAIDVNTGKFVGRRNLEDTILRTNLEAVKEVAYQLRLRNIGGMVIIDFIDMEEDEHRTKVLSALEDELKKDKARCNVVKISELGLVEMTRQRKRESLGNFLSEPCFYCEGKGTLKSKRTTVYEIFRELERQATRLHFNVLVVHAHPVVVDMIYGEEGESLAELEDKLAKQIIVKPRGSFHQEQYDIFGQRAVSGQEAKTNNGNEKTAPRMGDA
ncbi:MAG: Rne/Rng family ribonuclease [Myxococcales bacterium]|nr:Rne/Rng family ribonuclease [Myxococcales bacterium]|tara:strand:- start:701 stop:2482 length:1782 start_codon:yes stop_codon:yes gene_type:complete